MWIGSLGVPADSINIPNGTYDNLTTRKREVWHCGICVCRIREDCFDKTYDSSSGVKLSFYEFGTYPDRSGFLQGCFIEKTELEKIKLPNQIVRQSGLWPFPQL